MAKTLYCWRCKTDIPMLEEHEWEQVEPYLKDGIRQIMRYRKTYDVSLSEAKRLGFEEAAALYFRLTGYRETDTNAIWHHRLSLFGPPCRACGKPLRTPQAKLCAECGAFR